MDFVLVPFLAGLAAVSYGCWLAWPPLGWIVGGTLLAALAVAYARSDSP